jgi:hypothetical protein
VVLQHLSAGKAAILQALHRSAEALRHPKEEDVQQEQCQDKNSTLNVANCATFNMGHPPIFTDQR